MGQNSQNQERKSYLEGRRRVTVDATSGMPRVVNDERVPSAASAIVSENGQVQEITLRDGGDCANVLYSEPQPLALYAYVNLAGVGQTTFLFNSKVIGVTPVGPGEVPYPVGGLVPVGHLIFGHAGVSQTLLFNVNPGTMAKAVVLGSSGRFGFSVYPRYFLPDDTTALRKYIVGNPAAKTELTNEMWNTPKGNALVAQALRYVADNGGAPYSDLLTNLFNPALRAQGLAHFGYGSATSGGINRPSRVFYGTLRKGTPYAHRTRCPIAFNATTVMVVGGRQNAVANFRVEMIQQANPAITDLAINSLEMNAQPAGVEVPLTATGWIYVTSPDDTSALTEEIPFEIHYFLGL